MTTSTDTIAPSDAPATPAAVTTRKRFHFAGLLPYIGVFLFLIATAEQFGHGAGHDQGPTVVANAVTYLIGYAMLGAGISHIFFGARISRSIGFQKSPYELEVGFADLAMGIVGLMAVSFSPEFSLAVILMSSIFRVGCGIGHIRSMLKERNFAINNTLILGINFLVPAFLLFAYSAWN